MTLYTFLSHIVYAAGLFMISMLITRFMLHRARILDIPNERSSHDIPTPKSGGVAIVITFFIGVLIMLLVSKRVMIGKWHFLGFVISALLIAGISFYDDLKNRPYTVKLITQMFSICLVLAFGIVIDRIELPYPWAEHLGWWGYLLTFVWLIGLTNAFNFMDGLDGLAGGTALIVSAFFGIITFSQGSNFVYITCYTIFAGTLGFLIYNVPTARIFMGDVGSTFLGFTFAVLAIIAARYDASHTSFFIMPLLFFNFIYDTVFTFFRRLMSGERVIDAHRSHLYQLFQRLGYGHLTVTIFHCVVTIVQGHAALWMIHVKGADRALVFLPFLIFQVIYSIIIIRAAKKARLI